MEDISKLKTDATKKILGFEYQKFVALQMCLEGEENEVLYLECYGDVASKKESTEVKHHQGDSLLGDNHIDFWKTLYNWVSDFPLYLSFSRLNLFTTSEIRSDSIFYSWDKLSAYERLKKLESITPVETTKKYYQYIFNYVDGYDKGVLLKLIEKVKINHSNYKIREYLKYLENQSMMKSIDPQWRRVVLLYLFGYISGQATNENFVWKIDVNDFSRNFRYIIREFMKDDLPFPYVDKHEIDVIDDGYKFVQKIKDINCSQRKVNRAIQDFLRSNETVVRLIDATPMICDNIRKFDDSVEDMIIDKKDSAITTAVDCDACGEELMVFSRKLYDECIAYPLQSLRGVQAIEQYFQNGRIHNAVEENSFTWKISEEDIDEA